MPMQQCSNDSLTVEQVQIRHAVLHREQHEPVRSSAHHTYCPSLLPSKPPMPLHSDQVPTLGSAAEHRESRRAAAARAWIHRAAQLACGLHVGPQATVICVHKLQRSVGLPDTSPLTSSVRPRWEAGLLSWMPRTSGEGEVLPECGPKRNVC